MSHPIDMTGVASGDPTYLREYDGRDKVGRHVWAACRCGEECVVRADNLRRGLTTRCPAVRAAAHSLKGRTFGRLKAVRPLTKRASNGAIVWRCKCECGQTANVSTSDLTTSNEAGATRSCGRC